MKFLTGTGLKFRAVIGREIKSNDTITDYFE
jgi:hypothetical protein